MTKNFSFNMPIADPKVFKILNDQKEKSEESQPNQASEPRIEEKKEEVKEANPIGFKPFTQPGAGVQFKPMTA